MTGYVALLRGINVGGRNKVPMAQLRECLTGIGLADVQTYIQSGNVLFESKLKPATVGKRFEQALLDNFTLDSAIIRVLILSHQQIGDIVRNAPRGFGVETDKYKYDVIFLFDVDATATAANLQTHPDVDTVWPGEGVIYYRRLTELITRSRINKVVGTPIYQSMTIRNWNTTKKLAELVG